MEWLTVRGYEGLYEVSDTHIVRNSRNQRIIPAKSGRVTLCKDGLPYRVKVVDIVGVEYVDPKPASLTVVRGYNNINERIKAFPWWNPSNSPAPFLGDAGETLVCSELLTRGIRATFNPMSGSPYDVIADFGNGQIFAIQVKTTSGVATITGGKTATYRFSSSEGSRVSCSIFAFVAMDIKAIVFELTEDFRQSRTFSVDLFKRKAETSIDDCLCTLYSRMNKLPDWLNDRSQS